jgi:hypothetical protein
MCVCLHSLLSHNHRFILKLSLIISGSFELWGIHFQPKAFHKKDNMQTRRNKEYVMRMKPMWVFVCIIERERERIRNPFILWVCLCYFHYAITSSASQLWKARHYKLILRLHHSVFPCCMYECKENIRQICKCSQLFGTIKRIFSYKSFFLIFYTRLIHTGKVTS